ncbi:MAG: 3-isopropylmalate dehydratase small subunit [Candidatus Poribacteria bacterium]|nr:3-isopropylmalate dehydratase small subunit [Candidatus Poribacteria bacterium]|tara:strand:+ start:172 stop:756 length:585 start_codon:yes stop_codon:yes gene_type:complete
MEAFTVHTGTALPFDYINVDTDQIIPKQFLKRIERSGFGEFLFFDWRYNDDESINKDFILNQECYSTASILVAGANFGCGSSREHAPWALLDYGFKVIIAPSFADIFKNNCYKNGILPVVLEVEVVEVLMREIEANENYHLTVNLENQQVETPNDQTYKFDIGDFEKYCMLNGLDEIGWTLQFESLISQYETKS